MKYMKYIIPLVVLFITASVQATTYYIDYVGGSDSNNGTSALTPWKHCPGMQPFSGSYMHTDGDRFIFKGGVTWPKAAVPLYVTNGGAAGNYDYYGVDVTWYTGGSFTRPTFTANWEAFTNWAGYHRENMIRVVGSASRYIQFDNLKLTGWQVTDPVNNFTDCLGINVYGSGDILITNCWIGDYRPAAVCEGGGGVAISYNKQGPVYVRDCVFTGPATVDVQYKSDPNGWTMGTAVRDVDEVSGCDISGTTQGIWSCGLIHDNVIHDGGASINWAHENMFRAMGGNVDFYNNVCSNWGAVTLWLNPSWGNRSSTQRAWNNVFYWASQMNISNEQGTVGNTSSILFANNTIVDQRVSVGYQTAWADFGGPVVLVNNLFINDGSYSIDYTNSISNLTASNNAVKTHSETLGSGMAFGNFFEPTSSLLGVTDTGTASQSAIFDYDIKNVGRPSGALWDIGAYEFLGNPASNPVVNASFDAESYDTQTPSNWSEWNGSYGYTESYGGSHSGVRHYTHHRTSYYQVYTWQTITGLENGLYTLKVWALKSGGQYSCLVEAKDFDSLGTKPQMTIPTSSSYQLVEIPNINVQNGQCTIGIWSDSPGNKWAYFDDFELVFQQ